MTNRNYKYLVVAVLVSLGLHLTFLLNADKILLSAARALGMSEQVAKPPKGPSFPTIKVSTDLTDINDQRSKIMTGSAAAADSLTRELMARRIENILNDKSTTPKPKMRVERPRLFQKPQLVKAKPLTAPPPELLAIDSANEPGLSALPEVTTGSFRKNIDADKLPSFAIIDPNYSLGQQGRYQGGGRTGMFNPRGFDVGDAPKSLNFTDDNGEDGGSGIGGVGGRIGPKGPELADPNYGSEGTGDLDDLVSVAMKVYPQPDGSGYYRVDITPNVRSQRLRSVQKDVVFLIDCSTSISASKLERFKEGAIASLDALNPNDRINIVTFAERPRPLFPQCQPLTTENKAKATAFIRNTSHGGKTDVFSSLLPYIREGRNSDRPLMVFLLSDGVSTVSDRLDNDKFLKRLVEENQSGLVAIYTFSAGSNINSELMNFLAYQNRGLACLERSEDEFTRRLVEFIRTHTDMIVAHPRYIASNNLGTEIFPKYMPHLFRDEILSFWGYFPPSASELVLAISGQNAVGSVEQLIYKKRFADAFPGDASLIRTWAGQKKYHYIGQKLIAPDAQAAAACDREIEQLQKHFEP